MPLADATTTIFGNKTYTKLEGISTLMLPNSEFIDTPELESEAITSGLAAAAISHMSFSPERRNLG